ncbi:MAG TPA: ASKHA domain-containing protein, partial [Anaerolineae bacterium]|nr:ASKHA domain-containing protein [Anaerolineae bacterium]
MDQQFEIDLQPIGRHTTISAGQSLLEAAQAAGVELVAVCGGTGTCATCRVRVMSGKLTPITANEEFELSGEDLKAGYRLACQAKPLQDVHLDIPPESLTTPQRTQVEGREVEIELDPMVQAIDVQLPAPDLFDLRSDVTRLQAALGDAAATIEYAALTDLSDRLRQYQWSARIARRNATVIAVLPHASRLIGLAVDIGTTKLAAYLVDLELGHTIAKLGAMNPQIAYGEDVVSRIAYCNRHTDGRVVLQRKLIETLNALIGEMCHAADIGCDQIVEAVIVGNTAMHHLFAGLPVQQLGTSPYVAAISDALEVRARDIGLEIAPAGSIYLPPNIAGFVGADHVAMLLATDIWHTDKTVVALDIGTNTEITVAHAGQLVCCSCASGPAFEGAHIAAGMRAAPGAIERVQISGGEVHAHTIRQQPP